MRRIRPTRFVGTLLEINRRLAAFTDMFPIEFIGENFFLRAAFLTSTDKGLEISERFKAWTVTTWCIHAVLLLSYEIILFIDALDN